MTNTFRLGRESRNIRVFISSTFSDMQGEREELVKHVFPQLRKLCEQRGVTWGEVDLRWGITDEQKAEGKVLPICLAEIERCRPYFIGILGERYGWVPDEIPQGLIEEQGWLKEHLDHSVTALEILHGVLNDPEMADHAYFYFRSPLYIDSLSAEERKSLLELPTDEEIKKFSLEEAERRAEKRREKLIALKAAIKQKDFPVRENYQTPKELGQLVLQDLKGVIDELYPEGLFPEPLDRELAEHEAFAASRFSTQRKGVYIGRQAYYDRLDDHVNSDESPLVIIGESGSGKSALLANWVMRYRDTLPATQPPEEKKGILKSLSRFVHRSSPQSQTLLLFHFIGATADSTDWAAMLRRIMGEFKRHFNIQIEIPDKPDALRAAFANSLSMAAAHGRVILIIDALNQLEDRDGAPDLVWLPPKIPSDIRLILSSLPGRPLDELKKRGGPTLEVGALTVEERKELIRNYLGQYSKTLQEDQIMHVLAAQQTSNPLFLRALVEEIRLYGDYFTLPQRIDHYLAAQTIDDLFELILERYERDYEDKEHKGLVKNGISLLWAARRGLSEPELMELLGSDGNPLPRAYWSPLYLAAEHALVSRSGLLGFFHDYFRQAVLDRYLPTEQEQADAHLRIANYFMEQEMSQRKVEELPWQLAEAQSWEQLSDLLIEPRFFKAAWYSNMFDVKDYWARIEKNSSQRLDHAFNSVLSEPEMFSTDHIFMTSQILYDMGYLDDASTLHTYLQETYREKNEPLSLQASLGNQALILRTRGDLDGAMALHKEKERICRELGNKDSLQASLGNQAGILYTRGDLDGAMALHKEQERICRELGNKDSLQISLGGQALILDARGDLDGAMALHKEEERICRELGNKDSLHRSLGNQAGILYTRGDLDGAMALHKEQERICRELGNKDSLSASLGNQALILDARGDLDGAMALHKEEERICRELGNKEGLAISLINQALIMHDKNRFNGALILAEDAYRLASDYGYSALAKQILPILEDIRSGHI